MKRKRRLEIVVETERRFKIREIDRRSTALCEQCSAPLILAEAAVAATGLSSRAIHRLVENGELHFAETPAGALLICLDSFENRPGGDEAAAPPDGLLRRMSPLKD